MAREIVYSEDGIINARVKQKVDTLPNWEALDMTILDGEQAFVRTPDGVPINFKIGDGTKPFRDLPFWLDSGSPFKLRSTDTDYVQVTGGNTVVTHPGLIGFDDYPVTSTQLNIAAFRDADLTYDAVNGSVTITGFELQAGELLILSPPSMKWAETTGAGSALQALVERVDELERMAAPFVVDELTGESNGRVWWTGRLDNIPTGWAIDTDWQGRVPVGYNAADTDFNDMGKTGGAKTITISKTNLPDIILRIDIINNQISKGEKGAGKFVSGGEPGENQPLPPIYTENLGDGTPIKILPPYRVGCWIKYVGV